MTFIARLEPDRIAAEWEWLSARCEMPNLRDRLLFGNAMAFRIIDTDAAIILSVGLTKDTSTKAIWIEGLGGHIAFRPKQNFQLMGGILQEVAALGESLGCWEMRIEANSRLGWKLRLLPLFGFETRKIAGATVMRKELKWA